MSDDRLHFLLGIHNHQPVGNFDSVVDDAVVRAYHPFLETLERVGAGLPLTVHCSGGLLEALKARARPTFDLLGRLAAKSRRIERLVRGRARILVYKGELHEEALAAERLTHEDLLQALRESGCPCIHDCRLAVLEVDGTISVINNTAKVERTEA